jgi:hypothetical protein
VRLNRLIPINRICDFGGGIYLRLCQVTPVFRNLQLPMHIGERGFVMTSGRTICIAVFLLLIFITGQSANSSRVSATEPPPRPSIDPDEATSHFPVLELKDKDSVRRSVYQDVYSILMDENQCSRFFGGTAALEVLNQFSERLGKKAFNDGTLGVVMSGTYGNYSNARTGLNYRIFKNAVLNTDGPFYRSGCFNSQLCIKGVGSFAATTRQARMLMILHEMGHLIRGADDKWLIPDDGGDTAKSALNTRIVEKNCYDAIKKTREQKPGSLFARFSKRNEAPDESPSTSGGDLKAAFQP